MSLSVSPALSSTNQLRVTQLLMLVLTGRGENKLSKFFNLVYFVSFQTPPAEPAPAAPTPKFSWANLSQSSSSSSTAESSANQRPGPDVSTNQEIEETNADQSQAGVIILLISVGVTGK